MEGKSITAAQITKRASAERSLSVVEFVLLVVLGDVLGRVKMRTAAMATPM
jgi:hypothetical protein